MSRPVKVQGEMMSERGQAMRPREKEVQRAILDEFNTLVARTERANTQLVRLTQAVVFLTVILAMPLIWQALAAITSYFLFVSSCFAGFPR